MMMEDEQEDETYFKADRSFFFALKDNEVALFVGRFERE